MPPTAAAKRVAASPARRATASRPALKQRPKGQTRPRPRGGTRAHARAGAPARRPARSKTTPLTGFVPVVVGRTAGAVGGLADSSLMVRLTRGRLWIVLLGILLVGIVALNVWALSLSASSSRIAEQADGLKRANSALRARIAAELSNEQVQSEASKIGLYFPAPLAIRTVHTEPGDAEAAAKRLAAGELTLGTAAPTAPVEPTLEAVAPVAPVEPTLEAVAPVAPVEPTLTDPATGTVTAP